MPRSTMISLLWPEGSRRLLAVVATLVVVACLPPRPVFHAKAHVSVTALETAAAVQFDALRLLELVGSGALAWIVCCLVIAGASRRRFVPTDECCGAPSLVDRAFWKHTIAYALPSLLAFGLSQLTFWPAQMSPDSVEEWRGAVAGEISDIHTILHSALLWVCARISSSPALPVAIQAVAVAIATGSVLAEARHWVRSAGALWGLGIAIALWPANFTLATVLWKDVVAAAGLLFLLSATMMLVRTRGAALAQAGFRVFLVLSALLAGLSRHNLLPLLFVLPPAMFACYRHLPWRWIANAALPVVAVPLLLKFVVIPVFGIPTLFAHYRAINALHVIGAYVQAGEPGLDDHGRALVASVMPEAAWRQRYNCQSVVPLFFGPQTSFEVLATRYGDLNRLALGLILSRPSTALGHQACATNMLWKILPRGHSLVSTAPLAIADMAESRKLGLEMRPVVPAVRQVVDRILARTGKGTVSWIFWRPALPLVLLTLATLAAALGMNRPDVCLLALPAWINTATLGVAMGSPDYRYQYGVVLVGLMLSALLVLPGRRAGPGEAGTLSKPRQTG